VTAVVLVHSPAVGPGTWVPVARVLHALGHDAVVPDLRHIGAGRPPYWPVVADTVADAMGQLDEPGPVLLVGHSNAGLLLPTIVASSPRPVAGAVLVDAALPSDPGPSAAAPAAMLERLRAMAGTDGLLPRWTDWWPAEDVAGLVHDTQVREELVREQPLLPLDYYEQLLPVPASWWSVPTAYLRLSEAYDEELEAAQRSGWPTAVLHGQHLHQVVDPVGVADALLDLARRLAG
jgi:pimeloyl-ACP methyl ester carboxylesterase